MQGNAMRRRCRIWVPNGNVIPETARRHREHRAQLSAAQDTQDRSWLDDAWPHDRPLEKPGPFFPVTRPFASGDWSTLSVCV